MELGKMVPFGEVPDGEMFLSLCTKRGFYGIKVKEASLQGGPLVNAVITHECTGEVAQDAGTLLYIEPSEMVETFREKEPTIVSTESAHVEEIEEHPDGGISLRFKEPEPIG